MSDQIAQWLVSAKVSPPKQFINVCRRQSLLQQLKRNDKFRVVWIEAAAGYGKTLLVSQWREELLKIHNLVGWTSIDVNDEPDILIPYIAFSLHRAGVDMLPTGLLLPSFQGIRTIYSLGRLLNRIETSDQPVSLIFDDCENASAEIVKQVFDPLLRIQPENLRIVFICRKNPGVSLSNLSVQGRLLTIGPGQLSFNADEIIEYFGGNLDKKQINFITDITGGWPVALQLMRSFGTDVSNLNKNNIPHSEELNVYLREQLLDKLSDDEKDFLLEVSILNSVSADCADDVRGANNSTELIKKLNFLGGILGPLENKNESYRIHPLVREFLLAELVNTDHEKFLLLNKNYAEWLSRNALPIDAIRAALTANQVDLAVTIFERIGGLQLFLREGMLRLRMAVELFEGLELKGYSRVQLARSLIHAKNGQIKRANEAFSIAISCFSEAGNEAAQNDTAFLIDRFIVEICLIEYGCTPAVNALSKGSLKYIMEHTAHDPVIYGCISTMQCLLHLQAGSFDRCFEYGLDAIDNLKNHNQLYGVTHIHFHLGMAELARNRLSEANSHYEEAMKITRTHFPGDMDLIFVGDVVVGELYWELGDSNNAAKHLKRVISHPKNTEAWFDIHMAAYQTTAQYILEDSGLDSALLFLDREEERSKAEGLTRLSKYLSAVKLLLFYLSGETGDVLEDCANLVDVPSIVDHISQQSTWREIEILSLAQIRGAILTEDLEKAGYLISALLEYAKSTGNHRIYLYGMVQKIVLEQQTRGLSRAVVTLIEALKVARAGCYLRPFLQEQNKLRDLLALMLSEKLCLPDGNQINEISEIAGELNNIMSTGPTSEDDAQAFSAREVEILVELGKGQSDKLIGRSVGITAHGVRYHLKNIYFKMGVENRLQAISKARQAGIIDTIY